jgi:hypothetical protein
MNHLKINDDYRRMLLESAFWGKAGVNVESQDTESLNESYEGQQEVVEEGHEGSVCPLCISQLEAPIEPDRVLEHLEIIANVLDRLESLNESDEDIEEVIYEAVQQVLLQNEEDEDGEFVSEEDGEEINEEEFYDEDEESEEDEDEDEEVVEEGAYGKKGGKPIPSMGKSYGKSSKAMKQPKKGTC